jgi:hypothetical protein
MNPQLLHWWMELIMVACCASVGPRWAAPLSNIEPRLESIFLSRLDCAERAAQLFADCWRLLLTRPARLGAQGRAGLFGR